MAVSPKEELAEVVEDGRLEIITALSDGYMGSGGFGVLVAWCRSPFGCDVVRR